MKRLLSRLLNLFLLLALSACGAAQTPSPLLVNTATPRPTSTAADTPATESSIPPVCTDTGQTWTSPVDGMTLVCVPAGEFLMGSTASEVDEALALCQKYYDNCDRSWSTVELPQHRVDLDAFWMDQTEVTNAKFAQFVAETNHQTEAEKRGTSSAWTGSEWHDISGADWRHPHGPETSIDGLAEHPVVQISWEDAKAYCQWAQRQLPSEAQWEKAARGTDGRSYPWGNETPTDNLVNYADGNLNVYWADKDVNDGYETTAPVGSYPSGASPYGALDMAGNAWEWVNDWYDSNYYSISAESNPTGPPSGDSRVQRGGSWHHHWLGMRTSMRVYNYPDRCTDYFGFRCGVFPGK